MISANYVKTMAQYNIWQNASIYRAADGLDAAALEDDQGAFFGSIRQTLSHLLWADTTWMSRFDDWPEPEVGMSGSANWVSDWDTLKQRRAAADARIEDWSHRVQDAQLAGQLTWYSGLKQRDIQRPYGLLVTHFFNHQTHHRGQVHGMLTRLGAVPDDTDLFLMPSLRRQTAGSSDQNTA